MWTFIWIAAAAATIAFGFFIMGKVDRLLTHQNRKRLDRSLHSREMECQRKRDWKNKKEVL